MGQEVSTVAGEYALTEEQQQQLSGAPLPVTNESLQSLQQSVGAMNSLPLVRDTSTASNASSFEVVSIPSPAGVMSINNSRSPSRCSSSASSIMSFEMIQMEQQQQENEANCYQTLATLSLEHEESAFSHPSPITFTRLPELKNSLLQEEDEKYPTTTEAAPETKDSVITSMVTEYDNENWWCICPTCSGEIDEELYFLEDPNSRLDKYIRSDNMMRNLRGDGITLKQRFHTSLGARITHKSLQTRKITRLENKIELARTRAVLEERRQTAKVNHSAIFAAVNTANSVVSSTTLIGPVLPEKHFASKQSAKNQSERKNMMKQRNLPIHLRVIEEEDDTKTIKHKRFQRERYNNRREMIAAAATAESRPALPLTSKPAIAKVTIFKKKSLSNANLLTPLQIKLAPSRDVRNFCESISRSFLPFVEQQFRTNYPLYNLTSVTVQQQYGKRYKAVKASLQTSNNRSKLVVATSSYPKGDYVPLQGLYHSSRALLKHAQEAGETKEQALAVNQEIEAWFERKYSWSNGSSYYFPQLWSEWRKFMYRHFEERVNRFSNLLSWYPTPLVHITYELASLNELHIDAADLHLTRHQRLEKNKRLLAKIDRQERLEARTREEAEPFPYERMKYAPESMHKREQRIRTINMANCRRFKADEIDRNFDVELWKGDEPDCHWPCCCRCLYCCGILPNDDEALAPIDPPVQHKNRHIRAPALQTKNSRGKMSRKELKQLRRLEQLRRAAIKYDVSQSKLQGYAASAAAYAARRPWYWRPLKRSRWTPSLPHEVDPEYLAEAQEKLETEHLMQLTPKELAQNSLLRESKKARRSLKRKGGGHLIKTSVDGSRTDRARSRTLARKVAEEYKYSFNPRNEFRSKQRDKVQDEIACEDAWHDWLPGGAWWATFYNNNNKFHRSCVKTLIGAKNGEEEALKQMPALERLAAARSTDCSDAEEEEWDESDSDSAV